MKSFITSFLCLFFLSFTPLFLQAEEVNKINIADTEIKTCTGTSSNQPLGEQVSLYFSGIFLTDY